MFYTLASQLGFVVTQLRATRIEVAREHLYSRKGGRPGERPRLQTYPTAISLLYLPRVPEVVFIKKGRRASNVRLFDTLGYVTTLLIAYRYGTLTLLYTVSFP